MTDLPYVEALRRRNYSFVEKLGESSLARVYLLREAESFGLLVAKEIFRPEGVPDHEFFQLFLRETERLKELQHPGLPRIVESFVEGGVCWLLREYTEGKTPEGLLQASKRALPDKQILQWVVSVIDIFAYLHSKEPPVLFGGPGRSAPGSTPLSPTACKRAFFSASISWRRAAMSAINCLAFSLSRVFLAFSISMWLMRRKAS